MNFADIEASVNAGAMAMLANATALIGGAEVAGIRDTHYPDAFGDRVGGIPCLVCLPGDVWAVSEGDSLTIGAESFTVREKRPDNGLILLLLEKS